MHFTGERPPQEDITLLKNLGEDLIVLENSWKEGKIDRRKAIRNFAEIVDSVLDVVILEGLEPFESICSDIRNFLGLVDGGKAELEAQTWSSMRELLDSLKDTISNGSAAAPGLSRLQSYWKPEKALQRAKRKLDAQKQRVKEPIGREDNKMTESLQTEAQELLRQAQEALLSGNDEGAKELAFKAAELIARREAEEAKKKEKTLRADLEMAIQEEAEAEETYEQIKGELADRDGEITGLSQRLEKARAAFEEQQQACADIKKQIDEVEGELESLNERRKELLDKFQEALPARDAAERECTRLKTELDKLSPEAELITDSISAAESQVEKARQKRAEIEAELEKIEDRINA